MGKGRVRGPIFFSVCPQFYRGLFQNLLREFPRIFKGGKSQVEYAIIKLKNIEQEWYERLYKMGGGSANEIQEFRRMDIFDFWRHYIAWEKDVEEKIKLQRESEK